MPLSCVQMVQCSAYGCYRIPHTACYRSPHTLHTYYRTWSLAGMHKHRAQNGCHWSCRRSYIRMWAKERDGLKHVGHGATWEPTESGGKIADHGTFWVRGGNGRGQKLLWGATWQTSGKNEAAHNAIGACKLKSVSINSPDVSPGQSRGPPAWSVRPLLCLSPAVRVYKWIIVIQSPIVHVAGPWGSTWTVAMPSGRGLEDCLARKRRLSNNLAYVFPCLCVCSFFSVTKH